MCCIPQALYVAEAHASTAPVPFTTDPKAKLECGLLDYERSWRRHLPKLQSLLGPELSLTFEPCNVTLALTAPANTKAARFADAHIHLFRCVCVWPGTKRIVMSCACGERGLFLCRPVRFETIHRCGRA